MRWNKFCGLVFLLMFMMYIIIQADAPSPADEGKAGVPTIPMCTSARPNCCAQCCDDRNYILIIIGHGIAVIIGAFGGYYIKSGKANKNVKIADKEE